MDFTMELRDVWKKEREYLKEMTVDSKGYKEQLERVTELEKRLTDLEKADMENSVKVASNEITEQFKREEMEAELKDRKNRNRIEVAKIIVPVAAAFTMGLISMRFEKTDIVTSTAGKSSLRDILKFR